MDFKTNAKCQDCVASISRAIHTKFPDAELKFDLENADKVLHVHGLPEDSQHAAEVESAIKEAGFQGSWLTRGEENK